METFDENLYSRQLYVIGKDAMNKITQSSILISGMSGLGVEIAKCVILSGVKNVTIHSNNIVTTKNLKSNYYATTQDIGKNQVEVVKSKLASLNPYVNLEIKTKKLKKEEMLNFNTVIFCNEYDFNKLKKINKFLRQNNINFILANTPRVTYSKGYGFVFCDFCDNFNVNDIDGEEVKTGIIIEAKDNIIKTSEPHQLYCGDNIILNINKNSKEEFVDKIIDSNTFAVKNNLNLTENFVVNSNFVQIKEKQTIIFKSFEESLKNPTFTNIISNDFETQEILFKYTFGSKSKVQPIDADWIIADAKIENNEKNKKLINKIVNGVCDYDAPVCSVIGSITAQEAIKSITNKFTPINQWLFLDFTSITDINGTKAKETKEKLKQQDIFIVGAGALGCELLKNLAMIGVGNITITDMDTIEKSNLNRQFLFRNADIGKFKSECAKDAIKEMRPDINIIAQKLKVASETLSVYNTDFFKSKSCVLTALDNVQARMFVDSLCVENNIPLIDSGTLGTKGNVQVVIPHLTEPYGASRDPPEKSVPLCTIKNFPYLIDHTIQWARDLFEGYFVKAPESFMQYKKNPNMCTKMSETEKCELSKDLAIIYENMACDVEDCIMFAYKFWYELFRDQIYHLRNKFPENHMIEEKLPFWSGTKKFPELFDFDTNNQYHIGFIEATANLWADVFGLKHTNKKEITKILKNKKIPNIKETKEEIKLDKEDKEQKYILPDVSELDYNVKALSFEKDDDTNFHIDFVTSASNIRATNYKIECADKLKTKGIAGKIVPAIATTTSLICGLVTIELIKLIQGKNNLKDFTNSFVNLGLSFYSFYEPIKVKKTKLGDLEFSVWDNFKFANQSLKNIINHIKQKVGELDVSSISVGQFTLYNQFMNEKKREERLNKTVKEIFDEITEKNENLSSIDLSIMFDTEEDIDPISCIITF